MANYISGNVDDLDIKFATFDQGAAGSTDLVAAVAGKRIRCIAFLVGLAASGTFKFQSNATTDITGSIPASASTPVVFDGGLLGPAFTTNVGEKLNIVTATGAGKGFLAYTLVDH